MPPPGSQSAPPPGVGDILKLVTNLAAVIADVQEQVRRIEAQHDAQEQVRRDEALIEMQLQLGRIEAAGIDRDYMLSSIEAQMGRLEFAISADASGGDPVIIDSDGTVREPASGTFDVTVSPGEDVQAAVNRCPPGGCVLLMPGRHDGPLVLAANKEVHMFGRGQATLRTLKGTVVTSKAIESTLDGLSLRREEGGCGDYDYAVCISGGRLRLQTCDITFPSGVCVCIGGGADSTLSSCK